MSKLRGFKLVTTLVLVFKKIKSKDKIKYDNIYSNSKAEIIINESDIDDVFESIHITTISNIQKFSGKGSGWIIDLVIDDTNNISKYDNIKDNECFRWSIVRYLNPVDHNPRRITKADKDFTKKRDFKNIIFPVKIRDIYNIEKKNSVSISIFGYENKEKHPIYVSKMLWRKICMIILCIVEGNIFTTIGYKLLVQKKHCNIILKTA